MYFFEGVERVTKRLKFIKQFFLAQKPPSRREIFLTAGGIDAWSEHMLETADALYRRLELEEVVEAARVGDPPVGGMH